MSDYDMYLTPEQVAERLQLGTETVYRYLRSGKLRGSRISHKAWRISEMYLASFMKGQNVSELIFEEYLAEQGLGKADYEPDFSGATKKVDYRLLHSGKRLWFEVKEFAEDKSLFSDVSGGAFDPYVSIRGKINKASDKFRDYDGECCSLVFFNESANSVHIATPGIVLGAMLGNLSYRVPIDFEAGAEAGPVENFFGDGGKMVRPRTRIPQNTTISAIIALERLLVGQRERRIRVAREELDDERRLLTWEERLERWQPMSSVEEGVALRAIVFDNPYAAVPLPVGIFRGPFDERWSPSHGKIVPSYVGDQLANLERREQELNLNVGPLHRYLKRTE